MASSCQVEGPRTKCTGGLTAGGGLTRTGTIPLFLLLLALSGMTTAVGHASLPTPSQPILVVQNLNHAANPFGLYLSEILIGEGLMEFQEVQLAQLSGEDPAAFLSSYDIVILAETSLSQSQEKLFSEYVAGGGTLIAMRPDPDAAALFGLRYLGTRPEALLQFFSVETNTLAGTGLVPASLQYHGQADNYSPNGCSVLSWLWDSIAQPSTNPAIVLNQYGEGRAVAFTFDLGKSVVLTRQGNPAWRDTEGDGVVEYRPMDLFLRLDGPTWFAPERMRIPQADEAQRALANIVVALARFPLPRLWYLPDGKKSVLVNTGDAEAQSGSQLDHTLNDAAAYGARFTSYMMEEGILRTDPVKEAAWRAAGHEIGPHAYGNGIETCEAIRLGYSRIVALLQSRFGHGARTARSHTADWCGWVSVASMQANLGIDMDLTYYHYIPRLAGLGQNANGYFTGSGLPQRFCAELGFRLSTYQTATQWPDEWFDNHGYTAAGAFEVTRSMFEAAENGFYSAFVANVHHVRYDNIAGDITHDWANRLWGYAKSNGIPMLSAEELLDFVQARNNARFENVRWDRVNLSLDFVAPLPGQDLTLMLPANRAGRRLLSLTFDGTPVPIRLETLRAKTWALHTTRSAQSRVVATYEAIPARPVEFVQTTTADFSSGTLLNVETTEEGDGELQLRSAFYDPFESTSLGSQWVSALWSGGVYAPSLEAGVLAHSNPGPGAYVRSLRAFTPGTRVRAKVLFSKGDLSLARYVYFGLGGENAVPWALIGTGYGGASLRTSVYNYRANDPVEFSLGVAFDRWHELEIEWQSARVNFYVNGELLRSESITLAGPLYIFFSVADSTPDGALVAADWVRVEEYPIQSSVPRYTSKVLDAGWLTAWQKLEWTGSMPLGTTISFETRSGDNPAVNAEWSDWQAVENDIQSPASRCIQFRATLGTSTSTASPSVERVSISGAPIATEPRLAIASAGDGLLFTWPAWAPGWKVLSTTNLASPQIWRERRPQIALIDARFEALLPSTNSVEFFRLTPE